MNGLLWVQHGCLDIGSAGKGWQHSDKDIIRTVIIIGILTTRTCQSMHGYPIDSSVRYNFRRVADNQLIRCARIRVACNRRRIDHTVRVIIE